MAEELTTGTEGDAGTTGDGTTGTTDAGSQAGAEGQPGATDDQGTTDAGTQDAGETFFDPRDIQDKPELMAAYKGMQQAFGKKMEGIKSQKQKIEAYDAFYKDPLSQIQAMASQMGYQLTRAEATAVAKEGANQGQEPQTWDEVYDTATKRALGILREEFAPILQQVGKLRETNLEKFMDDNFTDWRMYEDDMMAKLKVHPSLANDPSALYQLSVPPEVLESRATQAALKKLQTKAEGSRTSGASTTKIKPDDLPDKPMSFNESVAFAKKRLQAQGIKPPG